jgi:ADP-ribosylglycohydrolase
MTAPDSPRLGGPEEHPDHERLTWIGLAPPTDPPPLTSPQPGEALRDRYRACLLGGAAGDALGCPVEGMRAARIRDLFPDGLRDFQPWGGGGPLGTFTDDTQLTIVMAEWLVDAGDRPPRAKDAAARIQAWGDIGRGIGAATYEALGNLRVGESWWQAGTPSAGNGAAMRAAPFGLRYVGRSDELALMATVGSVPTHADVSAVASAIVQAVAVNECLCASGPLEPGGFLERLADQVAGFDLPSLAHRGTGVRRTLLERIREVGDLLDARPGEVFDHFHNGAFVLETLPVVLWCLLALGDDPEEALVSAVTGGGDADTVAAMLGNLLGARHGTEALPERWIGADLEDRDRLVGLADALYDLRWG